MGIEANQFKHPEYLVSTDWLAARLKDPAIRIYDCTTHLLPHPTKAYTVGSGREDYDKGHIPGADFLDIQEELSDPDSRFRFTFPSPERFAAAVGRHGLGNDTEVVLYSTTTPQWATRVWWMLRAFGFDNARVLDGGLVKWAAEGRETSTAPASYAPAGFTPKPRDGLIVQKDEVLAAIGDGAICTINALSREQHAGGGRAYGRMGRISGSNNVPTAELLDPKTNAFIPAGEIAARFADVGADKSKRILTYCGGGIAASATAMLLVMLGHEDVGLYDNSMSEWSNDESLPMETG
jgi:thiosulfate/3-mercaptopyruvate sulfurtransferase